VTKFFDAMIFEDKIPIAFHPQGTAQLSKSQPVNAAGILLDGIVAALSDRSYLTPEQKQARGAEIWAVIEAFHPQDPLQIMLIGQALLFNELLTNGAHDVLRGMVDTLKLRAQSNVNALNRSLHQNLGTFLRLRDKSAPTANDGARPAAKPAAAPVEARPPEPKTADAPSPPGTAQPEEEASWIDEPYTTWVIETPAEAFARETAEREASAAKADEAAAAFPTAPRRRSSGRPSVAPEMLARAAVPELVGTS